MLVLDSWYGFEIFWNNLISIREIQEITTFVVTVFEDQRTEPRLCGLRKILGRIIDGSKLRQSRLKYQLKFIKLVLNPNISNNFDNSLTFLAWIYSYLNFKMLEKEIFGVIWKILPKLYMKILVSRKNWRRHSRAGERH